MSLLSDCEKCMEARTKAERQDWGCGYEPAIETASAWDHPKRKKPEHEPVTTTCIGYTITLPEVIETARAHRHWKGGAGLASVTAFFGQRPSDELIAGIEILDSSSNARDHWLMIPSTEGGGGK